MCVRGSISVTCCFPPPTSNESAINSPLGANRCEPLIGAANRLASPGRCASAAGTCQTTPQETSKTPKTRQCPPPPNASRHPPIPARGSGTWTSFHSKSPNCRFKTFPGLGLGFVARSFGVSPLLFPKPKVAECTFPARRQQDQGRGFAVHLPGRVGL